MRHLLLAAMLAIAPAGMPAAAQQADEVQRSAERLTVLAEKMNALQGLFASAGELLAETATLDGRISDVFYDRTEDAGLAGDLAEYRERVAAAYAESETAILRLRGEAAGMAHAPNRRMVENGLDALDVAWAVIEGTPVYLDDLRAAAMAKDTARFDRLSRQSMRRTSALLRTENALVDLQRETVKRSHPAHALQGALKAGNEATALFSDAGARAFGSEDMRVAETARAMRAQIGTMHAEIERGEAAVRRTGASLFLPSLSRPAVATLRSIIVEDFAAAFDVETRMAAVLEDFADILPHLGQAEAGTLEALDARLAALAEERIVIRTRILERMQVIAGDL